MTLSASEFSLAKFKNVFISMRDGVRLAADIYRPARDGVLADGQFPIILCRTTYDKSAQRYIDYADYFTPRGYIVVLQDLRGRYESEGTGQYHHVVNPLEGFDGYDTIEWLAAQPWSSGKIGMVGSSHPALTQVRAALHRPPHLTTIWPDVVPINSYNHQMRRGGAMALQMFGALFVHAIDAQEIRGNPSARQVIIRAQEQMRELIYATPFKAGHTPLAVVPNLEAALIDYYTHGAYDDYWAQEAHDFERHFPQHADIPVSLTGGWFDLFADGTPVYYSKMRAQNKAPVRLHMGPWTHTQMRNGISYAGDLDSGAEGTWGTERYFAEQLRWFDRWLKDIPNGVEADPPVQIFVMGGGTGRKTRAGHLDHGGYWRAEQEWPLARTQLTPFYLHADGSLTPDPVSAERDGDERTGLPSSVVRRIAPLRRGRPSSSANQQSKINNQESPAPTHLTFTYDPAHPVPTIGASSSGLMELVPLGDDLDPFWGQSLAPSLRLRSIVMEGAGHQQEEPGMVGAQPPYLPLAMRPDVLVFQTAPLEHAVEVTGDIVVKLWISSSAVDTDFTAKLIDVYPPNADYLGGYHLNLSDSIIRCRYRNSFEREELMTAGGIYSVQISLAPTSNLFKAGHRIRLDISSSNFPRFDLNPNTGEPMGRHTHQIKARNTVYMDAAHPSQVVLPIIPAEIQVTSKRVNE